MNACVKKLMRLKNIGEVAAITVMDKLIKLLKLNSWQRIDELLLTHPLTHLETEHLSIAWFLL